MCGITWASLACFRRAASHVDIWDRGLTCWQFNHEMSSIHVCDLAWSQIILHKTDTGSTRRAIENLQSDYTVALPAWNGQLKAGSLGSVMQAINAKVPNVPTRCTVQYIHAHPVRYVDRGLSDLESYPTYSSRWVELRIIGKGHRGKAGWLAQQLTVGWHLLSYEWRRKTATRHLVLDARSARCAVPDPLKSGMLGLLLKEARAWAPRTLLLTSDWERPKPIIAYQNKLMTHSGPVGSFIMSREISAHFVKGAEQSGLICRWDHSSGQPRGLQGLPQVAKLARTAHGKGIDGSFSWRFRPLC